MCHDTLGNLYVPPPWTLTPNRIEELWEVEPREQDLVITLYLDKPRHTATPLPSLELPQLAATSATTADTTSADTADTNTTSADTTATATAIRHEQRGHTHDRADSNEAGSELHLTLRLSPRNAHAAT